jgi:hypothetical protein
VRLNNNLNNKYKMTLETEIYQVLRKHRLPLKKREELIIDLLNLINEREKQLLIQRVSQRSELLKDYTKWLRQNDHLRNAPFPSLIDQYFNSL